MAILWWLAPAALTTTLSILWVARASRDRVVDNEVAVAKLAKALGSAGPQTYAVRSRPTQRSTGVARRRPE
jgi:hypothetical protein